ncbi:MAG: GNAT family N-acetyltransferase, partial [Longimicrobiales bacterium]
MAIEFVRVEAPAVREGVVRFFWEQQHWPGSSHDDYYRMWDWRYSSLSDGEPYVYIARVQGTDTIVGHIAVYPRRFQVGGVELKVGVPGNLVVRPDYRNNVVGPRIVVFPRALVRDGELDMVLAFANPAAHGLFVRLGFHDLGLMHTYSDVRKSAPLLRRRMRAAAGLGPLVDLALSLRRLLRTGRSKRALGGLEVRPLTPEAFATSDRSHWTHPSDRLVAADSTSYVVRRYLECPYAPRQMYGLLDDSGRLEGYTILDEQGRIIVWDCQVNHSRLREPLAISMVASHLGVET